MPLSSLISFTLRLKGRGHFLSPKEINFLKNLLDNFSEEEIKKNLERCFESLPRGQRGKTSLIFCKKFFNKDTRVNFTKSNNWRVFTLEELLKEVPPNVKESIKKELREFFAGKKPNEEELKTVLKLLLRKYL